MRVLTERRVTRGSRGHLGIGEFLRSSFHSRVLHSDALQTMVAQQDHKQPEFRRDPLTGRWVIVAPGRSGRPQDFDTTIRRVRQGPCPFCEGNEAETTPEVLARRRLGSTPNGPGWRVRVVSNKYPAVGQTEAVPENGSSWRSDSFPGLGIHEVIIETPRHVARMTELTQVELVEFLEVCRERLGQLAREPYVEYALIFKNVGPTAGASLEHSHSQLLAVPIVPPAVNSELEAARRHLRENGGCYYCQLLERETGEGRRIVFRRSGYTVFCPFASRFAYETWILPDAHTERFEESSPEALRQLATVLRETILRIETQLGQPGYNILFQSAPFRRKVPYFHWRVEILPSVSRPAGFEWGTGIHINPVFPEEAAELLRDGQGMTGVR